jgi:hypothetical protein
MSCGAAALLPMSVLAVYFTADVPLAVYYLQTQYRATSPFLPPVVPFQHYRLLKVITFVNGMHVCTPAHW